MNVERRASSGSAGTGAVKIIADAVRKRLTTMLVNVASRVIHVAHPTNPSGNNRSTR
jgi:hypothetical protein